MVAVAAVVVAAEAAVVGPAAVDAVRVVRQVPAARRSPLLLGQDRRGLRLSSASNDSPDALFAV